MTTFAPIDPKHVIVIGGGAAGFFAAINTAMKHPGWRVTILEKTNKLLAKVKISGGGRCNVTHHCFDNRELVKNYPRGNKELLQVFSHFSVSDTIQWFRDQGIQVKVEEDGRMFPQSDSSQTIIDCFLSLAEKLSIEIICSCEVFAIQKKEEVFFLKTSQGMMEAGTVICASGGHHKAGAYDFIKNMGHHIEAPIPSLFTLNLPTASIRKELQGISVQSAQVKIAGTKLQYAGPVLITHWGLSGPAVLKLSAFAAKEFFDLNYRSNVLINWAYPLHLAEAEAMLKQTQKEKHKAFPCSNPLFDLPRRLWEFLCMEAGMDNSKPWAEINNKAIHRLTELLCNSRYEMEGKTTFKEEFVTCGGVHLKEIDFKTMQSRLVTGLYFCGEVLNIDGITGGFNFQSAWSTAWICSESLPVKGMIQDS